MPNVAVVGCGAWGKNLVRVFYGLDALTMVCDTSPAGRERARQLAPGVRIVPGHVWVLTEPTIQGVVIATPAPTHYELAKQCLIAGLDVLVEKPLALSLRHALDLVETASRYGSVLMVGHIMLYHPAYQVMKAQSRPLPVQRFYSERYSIHEPRALPETMIWSLAPHDVSMMLDWMGKMPDTVETRCLPDGSMSLFLFWGDTLGYAAVGWGAKEKKRSFVVNQHLSVLEYDGVRDTLRWYVPYPGKSAGPYLPFPGDEPLKLEALDFLHCLETRAEPCSSGVKALDVIEVLEQAHRGLA